MASQNSGSMMHKNMDGGHMGNMPMATSEKTMAENSMQNGMMTHKDGMPMSDVAKKKSQEKMMMGKDGMPMTDEERHDNDHMRMNKDDMPMKPMKGGSG
jgi:hypothetical protein